MIGGKNRIMNDRHRKQYADMGMSIIDRNGKSKSTYQQPTLKPKIYRMALGLWVIQYKFSSGLEVVECHSSWTDCIDSLLVEIDMRAALRHVEGMGY